MERPPNRLATQTSPYLLQHAYNPVDWYPWGDEALAEARRRDVPILLSIGYAACHWCHVMERESFEDPDTAARMNTWYVNVKVDREERPDLDAVYMAAVQALSGHGGWPMTVFLTPDGKPFYGGTYFPPEDRHGLPSFGRVLAAVADAWRNRRDEIEGQGDQLVAHIRRTAEFAPADDLPSRAELDAAAARMAAAVDRAWGGFGAAPKFPQPMNLGFMLRTGVRGGDLAPLWLTLDRMARGGIFDQAGGGFHRYSVDAMWLVPHFEKMLYDNAQLLRLYARAWQVSGSELYRDTALATARYLLREMRHPDGGFFASQDADSEGVEGRYYVWSLEDFASVLGDDAEAAAALFGVTGTGNWEGANILWLPESLEEVAAQRGIAPGDLRAASDRWRDALRRARSARVPPAIDDKVLASWNGLTIAGLAEAGRVLGEASFVEAARAAAEHVLSALRVDGGGLARSWRDGRVSGPAFLDDHAMLADGLLALYETTFEPRWWEEALRLGHEIVGRFADPERGGFFDVASDAPSPVVRPKDLFDNALPGGGSSAASVLARLAALEGDRSLEDAAASFVRLVRRPMTEAPLGFGHALGAADLLVSRATEVAVAGDLADPGTRALLAAAGEGFHPWRVLAAGPPGSPGPALLRGRDLVGGAAAAYVCRDHACRLPVTDAAALRAELQRVEDGS